MQSVGYDILCGPLLVVQIILGSASVARRKILAEMGYEFTVMVIFLPVLGSVLC